ncbi:MAG TPA: DUF6763 family protein [Woeseiaceae bacterium]
MSTELAPVVGNWYRHLDKGQLFCVVALDDEAGIIELQHFDGDIEEVEVAPWYEMTLEPAEAPEDWTGPVDDVERDDLPYTETDMTAFDWTRSLQEMPGAGQEPWETLTPEDERDEWAEGLLAERRWPQEDIEEGATPEQESPGGEKEE